MPFNSLTELFNESHLTIAYDRERLWLYADWKGYQTVGSVQAGCERILEFMTQTRSYRILNDNTQVKGIWSGAAEWVAGDWFPRLRRAGMQCFAWVYSPKRFSQISTDTTLSLMEPAAHTIQVFHDKAEAIEWLHSAHRRADRLNAWVEVSRDYGVPDEIIDMVVQNNWTPVRAWREHLGLTQAAVAARLAVSQIEYAAQEAVTELRQHDVEKIAALFCISPRLLGI